MRNLFSRINLKPLAESEIMIEIEFEPVVNGWEHEGYPTKIAVLVVAIRDLF